MEAHEDREIEESAATIKMHNTETEREIGKEIRG
jgi:hypothetical protein